MQKHKSKVPEQKNEGHAWTRASVWVKELIGLPTYILGTLVLVRVTNGNIALVMIGLIPFVIAYNFLYVHLFPTRAPNGHLAKVGLLVVGQFLFWAIVWRFA